MRKESRDFYMGILVAFMGILLPHSVGHAEEVIRIGGVGSALEAMRIVGRSFEKSNPGLRVEVLASLGSAGAVKALAKGVIEIALLGRKMKDDESKLGFTSCEYAKTPFIFVTIEGVGISNVTTADIVPLFKGEKEKWPNGDRVRLVTRPAGDSDTLIVQAISPELKGAIDVALNKPGLLFPLTDQENADIIEKTPGAFGFSTLTQVVAEKRGKLKVLSFNGIYPSAQALANGSYPLFKPLLIVLPPNPPKTVQRFMDYIRSAQGRKILEETGNLVTLR